MRDYRKKILFPREEFHVKRTPESISMLNNFKIALQPKIMLAFFPCFYRTLLCNEYQLCFLSGKFCAQIVTKKSHIMSLVF